MCGPRGFESVLEVPALQYVGHLIDLSRNLDVDKRRFRIGSSPTRLLLCFVLLGSFLQVWAGVGTRLQVGLGRWNPKSGTRL